MSPPGDPPIIQHALQIAQKAQEDTPSLVRAALTQPKEPSVAAVMRRGTPIAPHAPDPTPEALAAARADTRVAAAHVNQRLDTIVPASERVAGGVYTAGAPGGGRWVDLPPALLRRNGLGFKRRAPATTGDLGAPQLPPPGPGHNMPPEPLEAAPTPGLGAAQVAVRRPKPELSDDDHLRRMWDEAVGESSAAAKHAVSTHNVRPIFTADDWHQALSLPLMDHLWYELSGEKLAENLPGLTHSEHMKMLDVLGATSARAKPGENLERTLAAISQHLRGVPVDIDLTIPSTVRQALARDHKAGTSALPGNKTGHFSDTLAIAGGVPARYPISVNDVWVGKMFGVPDEVMSSNQSLHEPMAKYFNKIRDFYNDRHKDELPFPYQSWNFQAPAWVHLRSKEADAEEGDAYHQVWGGIIDKLKAAGVPGINGDQISRQALMHPGFADALRRTTKPWRDAPKATVEFGTTQTPVGKRAHELYHDAVTRGDELSQKEYLAALTTAMYASGRGKGHPWERLKKAITGNLGAGSDITRIASPTSEAPLDIGGTFEGAVSPNIRIPLKDMDDQHIEAFNAVAGRHLKQDAMAASTVRVAYHHDEPRSGHIRGHSLFVPTTEQISHDHLRSFARALSDQGHDMSYQRHPNGYQFDVLPNFTGDEPKGIDETTLDSTYENVLRPHYGAAKIVPHDFRSVYTPAADYGKARSALTKRIRNEYLEQAAAAGVPKAVAEQAARAQVAPADFPRGGKKAWDVYRARHDHLAASEEAFKDLAKRVKDAHADFVERVETRRARETARLARPQKADGGSVTDDPTAQPQPPPEPNLSDSYSKPVDPGARSLSPIGLYSHAADVVWKQPQMKGTPQQFKAALLRQGVKPDEFKWSGYDEAFADRESVSKREVRDHFVSKLPPVEETQLGGRQSNMDTKYETYKLPGGTNYREVLLHLPPDTSRRDKLKGLEKRLGEIQDKFDELHRQPDSAAVAQQRADLAAENRRVYDEMHATQRQPGDATGTNYRSSHWDEPNVLAHLRMQDRTYMPPAFSKEGRGSDGERRQQKILHVEELQSDWGQDARDKGVASPDDKQKFDAAQAALEPAKAELAEHVKRLHRQVFGGSFDAFLRDVPKIADRQPYMEQLRAAKRADEPHEAARQKVEALEAAMTAHSPTGKPPAAPYIDSTAKWTDLALKRVLHEAAKGGYHKVVFTPGEEQAKRYDLSQHVGELHYWRVPESGNIGVSAYAPNGSTVLDQEEYEPKNLPSVLGHEIAQRIAAGDGERFEEHSTPDVEVRTLRGDNLKVGGEGMKGYYDRIVPKQLEKLAQQHDPAAKVKMNDTVETGEMHPVRRKLIRAGYNPNLTTIEDVEARVGQRGEPKFTDDELDAIAADKHLAETNKMALHTLEITPRMRDSILKGQRGFAAGGRASTRIDDHIYKRVHRAFDVAGRYALGGTA